MSTIESYTGQTAADARAKSSSWSELMKEAWESDPDEPRPSLEGEDLADAREAIGRARAVTLPDGQVWTARNGVNFWREGPIAALIQHWEKDARDTGGNLVGGLMHRIFHGDLANSGRIQDTFSKNGPPKEWAQFRFDFDPAALAELAGTTDRAAMAEAARELARTIHDTFHHGPQGGTRMVVSGPVHLDTGKPHVDFYIHHFEIDTSKNDVLGQVNLGKSSELRDEILRIRTAVRDRHGFDFEQIKVNNRFLDLPWDMPKSKAERLATEAAGREVETEEGLTTEIPERTPERDTALPPTTFRRPAVTPELTQVQQYRKSAQREAESARKALEEAEAREAFAAHVEAAFVAAEEAKAERDAANALAAERLADVEQKTEELASLQETLAATVSDLESANSSIEELSGERDALTRTIAERDDTIAARDRQIDELRELHATELEEAAERLAAVETSRDQWQASHAAVEEDLKAEQARHQEDNASAAAEIEKLRTELAAVRVDAERADQLRALAESQLETEREKTAAIQSRFDAYRTQISSLEDVDGQPVAGDGIDAIASDRRRAVPNAEFPADAKASRRWFGRQKFEWEDGTTVLTTRLSAKLTGGNLTPAAVATMIAHARREGWSPISISAHAPAVQKAITEAARSAGLVLEGEEPAASIAPAQQRRIPSWATKAPASWSKTEREAAQKALDKAKAEGKAPAALPLDEFGKRQHEAYQKNQQTTAEGGNELGPKKPQ